MNILRYLLMGIALVIIITCRVVGVHMTEGELWIAYWPYLLVSIALLVSAGVNLK